MVARRGCRVSMSGPHLPMRQIALACALAASLASPATAAGITIGVAAPVSGPSALLGEQVTDGARVGASALGGDVTLDIADDSCTAEGGAAAARRFAEAGVTAVVGFLCAEAIEAALPILRQADIPVLTVGVRADGLTDLRFRTGWPVWRLGPRGDSEQKAVGDILVREWREALFAIIDDGTIYGRELAESLRIAADQAQLKPVFIDTFRPQLDNQIGLAGRLRKAGATHVFAGGDLDDIAILGRDAAGLGMVLIIAGGESLRSVPGSVPLAPGTLMIGPPEWGDKVPVEIAPRFAAAEATADGYALPTYAAIEIITAAAKQAQASGKTMAEILDGTAFQTAIGPVDFDEKGDLTVNPYRLFRMEGGSFVEVD
jgi:branched-chain amino acid transport system substrate-binding protein